MPPVDAVRHFEGVRVVPRAAPRGRPGVPRLVSELAAKSVLTPEEIAALWIAYGGSPNNAHMAAAIGMAESSGRVGVQSNNPAGGKNWSVMQIWTGHRDAKDDPFGMKAAIRISKNGTDWSQWEVYETGAYKAHLPGDERSFLEKVKDITVGGLVGAVNPGNVDEVLAKLTPLDEVLGKINVIFDAHWWLRVGFIIMGMVAILAGVLFIGREFATSTASKVAKQTVLGK